MHDCPATWKPAPETFDTDHHLMDDTWRRRKL